MLRLYSQEDIKAIVDLEESILGTTLGFSYYESDLTNRFARHYVLEENDEIIGFLSSIFDGSSLEILNFGISTKYQNKGYGTKLLTNVLDMLICEGLMDVILEVRTSNIKAISLYSKLNFKVISTRKKYYSNGEDAYVMQKIYDSPFDIINLEANVFSKKIGLRYESNYKELTNLNYYDLFDDRAETLEFNDASYINAISNWYDSSYFKGFNISYMGLMHVNSYNCIKQDNEKYTISDIVNQNLCHKWIRSNTSKYGELFSMQYADFINNAIAENSIKLFACFNDNEIIGSITVMENNNSLLINSLHIHNDFLEQNLEGFLINEVVEYGKKIGKHEIYSIINLEENIYQIYEKMNFKIIEQVYQLFLKK